MFKKMMCATVAAVMCIATFTSCGADKNGNLDCCGKITLKSKGKTYSVSNCKYITGGDAAGTYTCIHGLYTLESNDGHTYYAQWNKSTERYEIS